MIILSAKKRMRLYRPNYKCNANNMELELGIFTPGFILITLTIGKLQMMRYTPLLLLIMIASESVFPKAPCRAQSQFAAVAETRAKLSGSEASEPTSKRLLLDEYATSKRTKPASIEKKYGASGDFVCGKLFMQAQVTKKRNVITTAGHAVHNRDCSQVDLSKCKFSLLSEGVMKDFRIKRLVDSDYKCESGEAPPKGDWAVLELEEDAPVDPYPIDRTATKALGKDAKVTSVGRSQDIYRPGATGLKITDYPRHYTDCHLSEVQTLWQGDDPDLFETNCGGYSFNSGGGLFQDRGHEKKATLVGIMIQSGDKTKKSNYVPVSGRLFDVLSGL